jgi:hypothetical protein
MVCLERGVWRINSPIRYSLAGILKAPSTNAVPQQVKEIYSKGILRFTKCKAYFNYVNFFLNFFRKFFAVPLYVNRPWY